MKRTDDVSLWPWPLTLDVTAIVSHTRLGTLSEHQVHANFVVWPTRVRQTLWPWSLTLEVMALATDAGLRPPSAHNVEVLRPHRSEDMTTCQGGCNHLVSQRFNCDCRPPATSPVLVSQSTKNFRSPTTSDASRVTSVNLRPTFNIRHSTFDKCLQRGEVVRYCKF